MIKKIFICLLSMFMFLSSGINYDFVYALDNEINESNNVVQESGESISTIDSTEAKQITVQVGPNKTYTSLQELFDSMGNNASGILTVELTGDTMMFSDVEVPKGFDTLNIHGYDGVSLNADSSVGLFANGVTLDINNLIIDEDIAIYGGGNHKNISGDTEVYIGSSMVKGSVYAGSLHGSISGAVSLFINESTVNTAVFGSNGTASNLKRSDAKFSTINHLYLGNVNANTTKMPTHYLSHTTIDNVYLSKNGNVPGGKVMFTVSGSDIGSFSNGENVVVNGNYTLCGGFIDDQDMEISIGNLSLGSSTSKVTITVSETNTMKLVGDKAEYLDVIEVGHQAKLYLNDSYTLSKFTVDNSEIYLPENAVLTVNKTMTGDAKVHLSKTYQDGEAVIVGPLKTSSKFVSTTDGIGLVKSTTKTNTVWTYEADAVVTVHVSEGGSVEKDLVYVTKGDDCEIPFKTDKGYVVESITVDGVDVTDDISGHVIQLKDVVEDVNVDIQFKKIDSLYVKEIIKQLPTSYSGIKDRDAILNAKILYEDFGGNVSFENEYTKKLNDALVLLPEVEFSSATKNATVTHPEALLSSLTKEDVEKILDGTYSKIVFGIHETKVPEANSVTCRYTNPSRSFLLKFGKRYVHTNTKIRDIYVDMDLTEDNTVNVSIVPNFEEKKPASGYNDRRILVYYQDGVWELSNQVEYEAEFMPDTTPNTTAYTIEPNKLGAYFVETLDVKSPSKDHIMVVFINWNGWFANNKEGMKVVFLPKDENGFATLSKEQIPTIVMNPNFDYYSETEGYWSPAIDTSIGGIKVDTEYFWNPKIKTADYSAIIEAIEKASVYTAENAYNYYDLKDAIDAVVWDLPTHKQNEVDKMAKKINDALSITQYKPADYTEVSVAIFNGEYLIQSGWVIDASPFYQVIEAIDYSKNITQQEEVDAMVELIYDAIDRMEYINADYSGIEEVLNTISTYDEYNYENWEIVEDAIAKIDYSLKINKQAEVNDMETMLRNALNQLIPLKGDYQKVFEVIDSVDLSLYYNTYIFENIVNQLNWYYTKAEQSLIDEYVIQLNDAKKNLELYSANYDSVHYEINRFNEIMYNSDLYTSQTIENVQNAIIAVVWNKTILEQAEVDHMAQVINYAITNLQYKLADYTAVNEAINVANSYNPDYYDNYNYLQNYINDINWYYTIDMQSEVISIADHIYQLINELVPMGADYTKVNLAIERANAICKEHVVNFDNVDLAIANVVWDLFRSNQEYVDSMAKDIINAINALTYTTPQHLQHVVVPTCNEDGYSVYVCECGKIYQSNFVEALGHNMSIFVETNAPTCLSFGIHRSDCTRCDYYELKYSKNKEHNYSQEITVPTCTTNGYTTYTCECGASYQSDYVAPLGHNMNEFMDVKLPTCTEKGMQRRDCIRCDYYEENELCEKLHHYGTEIKMPTCLEEGIERYYCLRCNYTNEQVLPKSDHNYYHTYVAATCTKPGYISHTCSTCGYTYATDHVNALEHMYGDFIVEKYPTCKYPGANYRICSRCYHEDYQEISPKEHNYIKTIKVPTCSEQGYTTYTCMNCSYSYISDYANALGHTYGEFNQIKVPTIVDYGKERSYCTRCDWIEIDDIDKAQPIIKVTKASDTSLKISWDKEKTATGYVVYRSNELDGIYSKIATIKKNSTTSYTDTKCTSGETYYYRVRGYKAVKVNGGYIENDYGPYSEGVAYAALKTPSLTVSRIDYDSISLSWKSIVGTDVYEIYRSTDNKNFEFITTTNELSYVDNGLLTGKTYYYKVRATKDVETQVANSSYSTVKNAETTLEKTTLSATNDGINKISLTWNLVEGANGYELYRSLDNKKYELVKEFESVNVYIDTVENGKGYYYKVRAYHNNVDGTKGYSSYSSVITATCINAPEVTVSKASDTSLKVSWNKVSGASGYEVYRATSLDGEYKKVTTITKGSTTSYTNSKLTNGTTYYYKVRAYKTISKKNYYGNYSEVVAYAALKTPSITVTRNNYDSIKITWKAISKAEQYEIYRSTDNKNFEYVATTAELSYVDNGLLTAKTYYYKVRATKDVETQVAYSSNSGVKSATTSLNVPTLSSTSNGVDTITVKWNTIDGADGYELYRATSQKGTYTLVGDYASNDPYVENAEYGKHLFYKVRAYHNNTNGTKGYSSYSSVLVATCINAPEVTVSRASDTSLKVSWNKVSGASGYEIYRATSLDGEYKKVTTITKGSTTSYTNSKLTNGTTYYYKVRAYKTVSKVNGYGPYSEVVAYAALKTPSITVTCNNYDSIKITWKSITGAEQYEIYRSTDNKNFECVTTTSELSYVDNGLLTGKTYYYRVRATKDVETQVAYSSNSKVMSAKTTLSTPKTSVDKIVYNRVDVAWNLVDGVDTYEVYRSTKEKGTYTLIGTSTENTYQDYDVTYGKTYYYKVRGKHTNVDETTAYSSYSSIIKAKVTIVTPKVSITNLDYQTNELRWEEVEGVTGYEVYRSTKSNKGFKLVETVTEGRYVDTELNTGTTYYYQVRAYREYEDGTVKYSSYANVSKKVVLAVPQGIVGERISKTEAKITFEKVVGADGYEIYRATSKKGTYSKVATVTETEYTNTKLSSSKSYYYKVRAYRTVSGKKVYSSYTGIVDCKK